MSHDVKGAAKNIRIRCCKMKCQGAIIPAEIVFQGSYTLSDSLLFSCRNDLGKEVEDDSRNA